MIFTCQVRDILMPDNAFPELLLICTVGNVSFYRVELQNALVEMLDPEITRTHFSKRMKSYTLPPSSEPTSPITLHFEDGTTATCDVLLGADGIHSATRKVLLNLAASDAEKSGAEDAQKTADSLRGFIDPIWSGAMIYRGVIPREKLEKLNPKHSTLVNSQMVCITHRDVSNIDANKSLISIGEKAGCDKIVVLFLFVLT